MEWRFKPISRDCSKKLEEVIKEAVRKRKRPEDTLLTSTGDGVGKVWMRLNHWEDCHTENGRFVCATSKQTGEMAYITSYKAPHGTNDLLNSAMIREACRATPAGPSSLKSFSVILST